MPVKNTYELDFTAAMLPYTASKTRPPVNRVEASLKENIEPDLLKQAVLDLVKRFPVLHTRLRKGFIRDHLEAASDYDIVVRDEGCTCRPFDLKDKKKPILRVLYTDNSVAVECGHLTGDGMIATTYLCSLIARYLELRGSAAGEIRTDEIGAEKNRFVLNYRDEPSETELTDFYSVVYEKPKKKKNPIETPAFQCLKGYKENYRRVVRVFIPLDAVKQLLKEKYGGCTVTEYLSAVYACAFLQLYEKSPNKKRPVRFAMASNLRPYWETDTLRNFSAVAGIHVVPEKKDYDFEDVLDIVRREMKEKLTKEKMHEFICQNVSYLKSLNIIPGFIKKFFISAGSYIAPKVAWPYTSAISNVGCIGLPPALAGHINSLTAYAGGFDLTRVTCSAIGVGNVMTVAFSSINESTVIQDFCVDFFKKDGLQIEIDIRF